jgi:hypothetical protein
MPKRDEPSTMYSCMMQPGHLRRVDDPRDERPARPVGRARRLLVRFAAAIRS